MKFLKTALTSFLILCALTIFAQDAMDSIAQENCDCLKSKNFEFSNVLNRAKKLALSDISILIIGDNGSGKELLADYIYRNLDVGNTYVNRNIVGAVVGVQPFGGQGLSGTGPKAGGPRYLYRFATEKTLTINTVATGGNTELFAMEEE